MTGFKAWCWALSTALSVFVISSSAFADDVEVGDEARRHFEAGVAFMQDPDGARYEEAYQEFKAAYADSPSWKILGNLGICAMKLERDGEAIDAFKKYLDEGGTNLSEDERAQFDRDMKTLEASAVTLKIDATPDGVMIVDQRVPVTGSPVTNRYGPVQGTLEIRVRPGHHKVRAELTGYDPQVWDLEAPSGSQHSYAFELQQPSEAAPTGASPAAGGGGGPVGQDAGVQRPIPTTVYVGLAATGVFVVGAGVTGVLAMGKKSDFDKANDGTDPVRAKKLSDDTKTMNLVTDVLMAGAVVGAGVTAYFYFTRPEVKTESASLRVVPLVGPNVGALTVSGSF